MQTKNYKRTLIGCFFGITNQAVITNVTALLFVPFMTLYGFDLFQSGLLIGINFLAQTCADVILSFFIDKIPFRKIVLTASSLSALGLIMFGILPFFVPAQHMFLAMAVATVIFASSSGMLEVTLSPIVDNIPESEGAKGPAMSLMHSFYAWGQVFCILFTGIGLLAFGYGSWNYLILGLSLIPIITIGIFRNAPLDKKPCSNDTKQKFGMILSPFFIAAIIAIFTGGISEVVMNQWVSTFVVTSLGYSKATADLVGMCLFAVFLGLGRALYGKFGEKFNINKTLIIGATVSFVFYVIVGAEISPVITLVASILCGFSVSLLWPGTLVVASRKYPRAGAWLFAALAIAGDVGGSVGPGVTGALAENIGFGGAFLLISAAPLICLICHLFMYKKG